MFIGGCEAARLEDVEDEVIEVEGGKIEGIEVDGMEIVWVELDSSSSMELAASPRSEGPAIFKTSLNRAWDILGSHPRLVRPRTITQNKLLLTCDLLMLASPSSKIKRDLRSSPFWVELPL
jgi:hypothetical protein